MTTELAVSNNIVSGTDLDEVQRLAKIFSVSSLFSAKGDNPQAIAQTAVKIMAGMEIGMGPFASVQNIHVIHGNPSFSAHMIASSIKASPKYDYQVLEYNDQVCSLQFYEGGKPVGEPFTYSTDDAKAAGLLGKDMWKKYPKAMLFSRAISAGYRTYCPDVLGGLRVYVPEEMGANVDEEGNPVIVDGEVEIIVEDFRPDPPRPKRNTAPKVAEVKVPKLEEVEELDFMETAKTEPVDIQDGPSANDNEEGQVGDAEEEQEYFSPYANATFADYEISDPAFDKIQDLIKLNSESPRAMNKKGYEALSELLTENWGVDEDLVLPFFELVCQKEFDGKLPGSKVGKPMMALLKNPEESFVAEMIALTEQIDIDMTEDTFG